MKSGTVNFAPRLIDWYNIFARDLPWRKTRDPYKIWISEVMLQQTTVTAVIPYFVRWINEYPDLLSVAKAPLEKILKSWQGLGYYSRARNIHAAAKLIVENHSGQIPPDKSQLMRLPGMGPYTTGAVLSIAFDQREPIIDANVRRVLMRQLKLEGPADLRHDKVIRNFLLEVMPQSNNRIFNQALMELGALICKSSDPDCGQCPVRSSCLAYQAKCADKIPKPKKQKIKTIRASLAVLEKDGKYFMQKRPTPGLFAGLWEFPGGKIKSGESPRKALKRELKEELNIEIEIIKKLPQVIQYYTKFKAVLHVWLCRPLAAPKTGPGRKWLTAREFYKYPMPSGTVKIIKSMQ